MLGIRKLGEKPGLHLCISVTNILKVKSPCLHQLADQFANTL